MPIGIKRPGDNGYSIELTGGWRWITLDGIVVFLWTPNEHINHSNRYWHYLTTLVWSWILENCKTFTKPISYLGHVIWPALLEVPTWQLTQTTGICDQPHGPFIIPSWVQRIPPIRTQSNVHGGPLYKRLRKVQLHTFDEFCHDRIDFIETQKAIILQPLLFAFPPSRGDYTVDPGLWSGQISSAVQLKRENITERPLRFRSCLLMYAKLA